MEPVPGGLFKTRDKGETWFEISNSLTFKKRFTTGIGFENFFYNVILDPIEPNIVYFSGYLGELYKSEEGGQTWKDFSKGLTKSGIITDLDIDAKGQYLVASQKAGGVSRISLR